MDITLLLAIILVLYGVLFGGYLLYKAPLRMFSGIFSSPKQTTAVGRFALMLQGSIRIIIAIAVIFAIFRRPNTGT